MIPGAVTVPIAMRDLNNSPIEGATLTCTVSIDGAAFAASTNSAAEVGSGLYSLALEAAERGTHQTVVKATDGTYTTLVTVTTDATMRGTDAALLAADYTAPANSDITAIKAKTDNLPAAPAATGDAMTLTPEYDHAKDDVLTPLAAVDGKVDAILAEDVGADLGTDVCTITLRDESGSAVPDARVYVSSDEAGMVRSDLRVTNALGQVAFDLTEGETYYLWAFSTRVDFTAANPMAFVAAAD